MRSLIRPVSFSTMSRRTACAALTAAAASLTSASGLAQGIGDWPNRPVSWIIATSPGGGVDFESRLYSQKLNEAFGKPFVLDYKPGAGSTIGAAYVSKAAPDGYTILSMTPSHTISPLVYATLPYNLDRDFSHISLTSKRPSLFLVHPSFPAKDFKQYVALARQNPDKYNIGTSGAGTIGHLALEWLHSLVGAKVTYVNFKGGGPSYTALISGQLDGVIGSPAAMIPHIKSGKARALVTTTSERLKVLPDLPTVQEEGYAGYDYAQWIGVVAPARTPVAIRERLSAELAKIVKMPDVYAKVADDGTIMIGSSPEYLRKYISDEAARWRKVVNDSGIKLAE